MIKPLLPIVLSSFVVLSACSESTETTDDSSSNDAAKTEQSDTDDSISDEDKAGVKEGNTTGDDVSSRYHYDEDWEAFKAAVIKGDKKGVEAYINSDNVDAETLITAFSDPDFMAMLKKGTYEDLETDTSGEEVQLVFSAAVEGDDGEGNIFESGLYLYFVQTETGLMLQNFLAAG